MKKFTNSRAEKFLNDLPRASLEDLTDTLTTRCKFNFSYFDVQAAGQDFCDWTPQQLHKLLDKLKAYCQSPLDFWRSEKVLVVYGDFPKKTDFTEPKHIPHQVLWARFRMESAVRLVGFIVPDEYAGRVHPVTKQVYDRNTFYVTFLDKDHKFWKTERR
jgi:hypothetical protein